MPYKLADDAFGKQVFVYLGVEGQSALVFGGYDEVCLGAEVAFEELGLEAGELADVYASFPAGFVHLSEALGI